MKMNSTKKALLSLCMVSMTAGAWASAPQYELTSTKFPVPTSKKSVKAPARALESNPTETLDFTYAFEAANLRGFGQQMVGKNLYQAFYVTPELATLYAGAKVTAMNLVTSINEDTETNQLTDVTVYLMDDLDQTPFYTQKATVTQEAIAAASVTLTTPYTVTAGKGFVVAYSIEPKSASDYYLVCDDIPRAESNGCYVGFEMTPGQVQWADYASQIGNLNIGITLESDNLPHNGVTIYGGEVPTVVFPGVPFDADLVLVGDAVNSANSVEVTYKVNKGESKTQTITLDEPLPYRDYQFVTLKDVVCDTEGSSVPFEVNITKVNGENNTSLETRVTFGLICFPKENGFKHTHIIEEGTGTWCGWCPAGIEMMEYLKEKYSDDVIRVAVHYNDQMSEESTDVIAALFSGFPSAYIDRSELVSPTSQTVISSLDAYLEKAKQIPAFAEISELKVTDNQREQVKVEAGVRFAISIPSENRYGISYYIVEDEVGPYRQTNYYAGGQYGEMGDWANRPSSVLIKYNDVARYNEGGFEGNTSFLPANIQERETYTAHSTLPLDAVSKDTYRVVAFLTDNWTGAVLNAREIEVTRESGVTSTSAETLRVTGAEGMIMIEGEYSSANVYDLGGRLITSVNGVNTITLDRGMYIITVDGKTFKAMVR